MAECLSTFRGFPISGNEQKMIFLKVVYPKEEAVLRKILSPDIEFDQIINLTG